jgi:hypothetical protein
MLIAIDANIFIKYLNPKLDDQNIDDTLLLQSLAVC